MSITTITSTGNSMLKRLRSLKEKKYRRAEGLFLAEGLRILTDALETGWVPEILLMASGKGDHPLVRRLIRATLDAGGQVLEVSAELLSGVTGKDNPQAVVAAFRPRPTGLEDLVPAGLMLVAERLRDPGNLGTLLRSCDATGTGALILLDEVTDPTSPEAVRASMGAFFTVTVVQTTTARFLDWTARHGARLTGAALDPRAIDYRAAGYPRPQLILLGNEAQGLPEELKAACDQLVMLPMRGRADSLNVAMAGTLLLYEAMHRAEVGQG